MNIWKIVRRVRVGVLLSYTLLLQSMTVGGALLFAGCLSNPGGGITSRILKWREHALQMNICKVYFKVLITLLWLLWWCECFTETSSSVIKTLLNGEFAVVCTLYKPGLQLFWNTSCSLTEMFCGVLCLWSCFEAAKHHWLFLFVGATKSRCLMPMLLSQMDSLV